LRERIAEAIQHEPPGHGEPVSVTADADEGVGAAEPQGV